MAKNNPTSFRFPFESQIAKLPPEVQQVHRNQWNAVVDIQNAIKAMHSNATATSAIVNKITQNVNTSNSSTAGVSSFNSLTGAVNYFPFLGSVNDQTGVTSYITQTGDNGVLILVNDASPVAVTLNSAISNPYFFFVENQGTGTATLTPSSGNINGVANLILLPGYFTITFFDGNNWWAMNLPIVPVNTPSVLHEWLNSYNATTGVFTATQPAFSDISGTPSTTQVPFQSLTTTGAGVATLGSGVLNIPTPVLPLTGTTGSLGGSPMTLGQTITTTATVTGATTSMVSVCSPVTYPGDGFVWDSYISAAGTVTVRLTCVAIGTPAASVYQIRIVE